MFDFHDISQYQEAYDMDGDKNPVVAIRMSWTGYGSKVSSYDAQAARNYNNAIRTGKVPILYHFAGGGDPVAEADFFVGACSPLADNDVLCLDYELTDKMDPPPNPAAWCATFVKRVHERTGIWPLFYTYFAMLKQYGFGEVLQNCGLWIADYAVSPDADIPGCPPYIIHQYQGSPLDTDRCYIPLDTLKKYGYHAAVQPPAPAPAPIPDPVPTPVPEPAPAPPTSTPSTPVENPPTPVTPSTPIPDPLEVQNNTMLKQILAMVTSLFDYFRGQYKSFAKYIKKG